MQPYDLKRLVREFLTDKKIIGLIKLVKPLDLIKTLVRDHGLCAKDAALATLDLVKGANNFQDKDLDKHVGEGLPLGSMSAGEFPVPVKLKKKKDSLEELSPLRGEPEFQKHLFPPERHRKMPQQFPYDDQTVRWSKVRGTTPKRGHST
ncbi:MAG: hypothetical protein Q8Q92_03460 [bacterium]|nr:hypothetical protein [bacterium]